MLLSCAVAEPVVIAPAARRPVAPQIRSRMSLLEAAELTLSHWDTHGERAFDAALDVLERKVKEDCPDGPLMAAAVAVLLRWEERAGMDDVLRTLRNLVDERAPTADRHGVAPTR